MTCPAHLRRLILMYAHIMQRQIPHQNVSNQHARRSMGTHNRNLQSLSSSEKRMPCIGYVTFIC
jgi:hypothetical protein